MGEGEGGGGQDEDLVGSPSPSSPPTEGRGDFVGLRLFNYGLLSNDARIVNKRLRLSLLNAFHVTVTECRNGLRSHNHSSVFNIFYTIKNPPSILNA